ncbi:MAG TPA: GMC family oxidoreductase [Steroidobacteraceae bacterium]|nr:GMC family oxidoreductase [Steroidobacteraceae bacterium]
MIDDALELRDTQALEADVCIVGAGAAGITLALELADSGIDVLLLESGGLKAERDTQQLYEGAVADERLHSPPHRFRQRRFGGSTTVWGGRCVPLDPIDFEAREYIPYSGWPIGRDALLPFYPRANELCEAGAFVYRAGEALRGPLRPMIAGFESAHFTSDGLERFSCPTDFGARHAARLRAAHSVRVLLHANVTEVRLLPGGQAVESLLVRTLRGTRLTVRASRFVLATGGLEIARLLLSNRNVMPRGIGNEHDVVGRYYMCHIAGAVGRMEFRAAGAGVWHGYDRTAEGIYCRRRLALTPETQRRLRIGNFIARLHHPRITDPAHRTAVLSALQLAKGLISYEYGKRLHGEERMRAGTWLRHVRNVAAAPHEVMAFGVHMLRDRFLASRKFPSIIVRSSGGYYSLDFHAEQEPNPASRITLTEERDALGVPRLRVDWRYTAGDVRTVQTAVRLLAEDIRSSGVGKFDCDPQSIEREILHYGAYGGHHLGTARMGTDLRTSVVDPNCRVHGIRNLYIAGGAVFPTSSQANPTLTIVALAMRLAAHLAMPQDGRGASRVTSADDPSRRSQSSVPSNSPA